MVVIALTAVAAVALAELGGAAVAATRAHAGDTGPLPVTYRVDVPGGEVEVELTEDLAYLTGPAVIVAHGQVLVPEEG